MYEKMKEAREQYMIGANVHLADVGVWRLLVLWRRVVRRRATGAVELLNTC